jgi:hypothetical protein
MLPGMNDPFLAEIEAFLTETGLTATTFGRLALGDPGFVFDLRNGRDCRRSTERRAREQISQYRRTGDFAARQTANAAPPREAEPGAECTAA